MIFNNCLEEYRYLILKRTELENKNIIDKELNQRLRDLYIECFNYIEDTIELEKEGVK